MIKTLTMKQGICTTLTIPGDKSISHRAVMFGAIARGTTQITGFLTGDDCLSTIACFQKLGINIEIQGACVTVHGQGLHGLKAPSEILDVGNSGTTLRLLAGILSPQGFNSTLTGDASIQTRPMDRVFHPLRQMGANLAGTGEKNCAPIKITGTPLKGVSYTLPVASAQVKSAILLASLYTEGETVVQEPLPSRDHTEIMLNYFGANIRNENGVIRSQKVTELYAKPVEVPGDISSAAFFIVAGLIVPGSCITITNVGVNPTRTGIIDALQQMGGHIVLKNKRYAGGEPVADIEVKTSVLDAINLSGEIIPRMIDEIPVFAVAAACAKGTTLIKDATELKVKESNRIQTVVGELTKMGASLEETHDGMKIHGGTPLTGCDIETHNDHRIAMAMAIAALAAKGETRIYNSECVSISFPDFFNTLENM